MNTAESILKAALTIPKMEQQLICEHNRVTVTAEEDRYYADCDDCGKNMNIAYDWEAFYAEQERKYREYQNER